MSHPRSRARFKRDQTLRQSKQLEGAFDEGRFRLYTAVAEQGNEEMEELVGCIGYTQGH
jgi:hypothetical protein